MSIIFIAGTMGTRAPFIVLQKCTRLRAHDMLLLADGIVDIQSMQREHLAIYVRLTFSIRH